MRPRGSVFRRDHPIEFDGDEIGALLPPASGRRRSLIT
jgi:hypothetical protein